MPISAVGLLAYDYRYIFSSILSYYEIADEIILGLDRDRISWNRLPFAIDMAEVRAFIDKVDHQKKIRIVEEDFHSTDSPLRNETLERRTLSLECTPGNWVLQVDADEILLNPVPFKAWLETNNPVGHNVNCRWLTVFKSFGEQVVVIDPPGELVPMATVLRGQYTDCRRTDQLGMVSPLYVLHYSWGRTAEEIRMKLRNWGHAKDFDTGEFFKMWDSITPQNYQELKNFHPLNGPTWQSLKLAVLDFPGVQHP